MICNPPGQEFIGDAIRADVIVGFAPYGGVTLDYWRLVKLAPDVALAPVSFTMATLDEFATAAPFDYGLLCHSPSYTPATADALIPIVGEYIHFQTAS